MILMCRVCTRLERSQYNRIYHRFLSSFSLVSPNASAGQISCIWPGSGLAAISASKLEMHQRRFCSGLQSSSGGEPGLSVIVMSELKYDHIAEDTLQSLWEYLDSLVDLKNAPKDFDVTYSQGVLTIMLGSEHGIYVINKQSPNKQIWLSSPLSGPKRYDFVKLKRWIYTHDGVTLHDLLTKEFRIIFKTEIIDFAKCQYG